VIITKNYLFLGELSGALGDVNVGLLATNVGVTTANALDGGHREHDLGLAVDVRVHDTQNVLELVRHDQALPKQNKNNVHQPET
jgi:hypothetical protein